MGVCAAPLNAVVGSDRADHHRRQPIRDGLSWRASVTLNGRVMEPECRT